MAAYVSKNDLTATDVQALMDRIITELNASKEACV